MEMESPASPAEKSFYYFYFTNRVVFLGISENSKFKF